MSTTEQREADRERAALKAQAREEKLRRALALAAQGEALSDIARRLKLDRRDVRKALIARVDFPPAHAP